MADDELVVSSGETAWLTPQERLTEQFYLWEIRGRGWQLWNEPVTLEPPFRPFLGHFIPFSPPRDDARKPTFLSTLVESITGRTSQTSLPPAIPYQTVEEEIEPEPFAPSSPLVELQIVLPEKTQVSKESTEQFLLGLKYARHPLSFEVVGLHDSIRVQLACREEDLAQLRSLLKAYFPDAVMNERGDFLTTQWDRSEGVEAVAVDFGLSNEFMAPLRFLRNFDVDPLIGIAGGIQDVRQNECAVLQVLFQAARYPWAESIMRSVTDWEGRSFLADAPEMVGQAKQKISRPLFAAVVRVAAQSSDRERAWDIARAMGGALAQFANPTSNEFIPLSNDDYPDTYHIEDILERKSRRSGMILNADELISLVHLPSSSVRLEKLAREEKRTKAAPQLAVGHALVLGENTHAGKTVQVTLGPEQRIKHTYVIGASGTGKSTLLLNMIVQDIQNGEGIGILDPHGDLIDQVMQYIPENRFDDVVLLDPADEEYPVGFNILSAHSELEKTLLSSDLGAVFRRLSTSWGDQMTSVLGNGILAFLESRQGGTLADLRRFLVEAEYRRAFLETVRDPEVVYYWQKEFPLLTGKPQAPLLTRLDTFLRPKLIRYMISQKENRLDFRSIMDGRKIFMAKLAQGAIGEENAYLLGSFIVSKLHQVAMARQEVKEAERQNFYLYIDEFHNFVTPSMASILSGARKYHLGLILAHQELRQLWNKDTDVASAVISNPYTRICFRLGDFDAQKLRDGFSFYEAKDLQNLGIGEAIARIERAEFDFNLKTLPLPKVDQELARVRSEKLIALSREKYGRSRAEVEKEVAKEHPRIEVTPPVPQPTRRERPVEAARKVATPIPARERVFEAKKPRPTHAPPEQPQLGRGGQQHKYLQNLVKRLAEDKGYKATIEQPVLGGVGSVDVSLEKDGKRIACEISVTTDGEQELGNIQKCLASGYDQVILLPSEKKDLNQLREFAVDRLGPEQMQRVLFMQPEEFLAHLEETEARAAGTQETIRGYRVKVKYKPVGAEEKKSKRQAISQVILQAFKRLKGDGE